MRTAGTLKLGDLTVSRLGYGAMRLPGPMVWGEPEDPERARRVLRRAVELGINLIDTAWYYGPFVSNRLIAEALHPYPRGLVIDTKLGGKRLPDKSWAPALRPEELRKGCEDDLRTLKLERVDLCHFRYISGSDVPFEDGFGALIDLQREGKIRHLGLSNVTLALLERGLKMAPIVSVQNIYSAVHQGEKRQSAPGVSPSSESPDLVLEACTERKIPFMPFFPLAMGGLGNKPEATIAEIAGRHRATPAQISIAWLLARSPFMLPIPGTGSVEHLEENWRAQELELTPEELRRISKS